MRVGSVLVNITLAAGVLASTIARPSDGSESDSIAQCGLRGWDRHIPVASKADSSGQRTNFEACRGYCEGFQSFAIDETSCVCYAAPTTNNVRQSEDSPFLFYDIGCLAPVKELAASTNTKTTIKTTVTSGAARRTSKVTIFTTILVAALTTFVAASPTTYMTTTVAKRAGEPQPAPVIPKCFKLKVVGGDKTQNGRWLYDSANHLYLYPQRLENKAEVFKLGDDNMLYNSENKVTNFTPVGRLSYGPLKLKQSGESPVCIVVETGNFDGTEWELLCELNGNTTFYAHGLYLYWGTKVPQSYDPIRLSVVSAKC